MVSKDEYDSTFLRVIFTILHPLYASFLPGGQASLSNHELEILKVIFCCSEPNEAHTHKLPQVRPKTILLGVESYSYDVLKTKLLVFLRYHVVHCNFTSKPYSHL